MKKFFAIIALCLAALGPPALAAELKHDNPGASLRYDHPGGTSVTVYKTPCEVQEILAWIDKDYRHLWYQARIDMPDLKGLPACWSMAPKNPELGIDQDYVYIVDILGRTGVALPADFKQVPKGVPIDR